MKTIAEIIHHNKFPLEIFDSNGNECYFEDKSGYWQTRIFGIHNDLIYFENSDGWIEDNQ